MLSKKLEKSPPLGNSTKVQVWLKRIFAVAQQTMLKEKVKGYLALCRAGTVEDGLTL